MKAEAFWITAERTGAILPAELPTCDETDVRVRTLYTGISRGTESLVWQGLVPAAEHERMHAPFQQGDFSFPLKYGYSNVGVVEQGPIELRGKVVFCLYPHQDHYVVPADAVTLIPENIPPARAVLSANLETAINALWDAAPCLGDRITVVGAGVVGCLVAWLAAGIPGCEVQLLDTNPTRESLARDLGVQFCQPEQAAGDRDIVIHASASEAGLVTALHLAGVEATILELSWYGERQVTLPLGQAFHSRRLQLRSSQVGMIAPLQRSRWTYKRRLALALSLLEDDVLDRLISGESRFDELPRTMDRLMTAGQEVLCHRIVYPS